MSKVGVEKLNVFLPQYFYGKKIFALHCYNKGNIIGGTQSIGGIAGKNTNGIIKNSYNISDITTSSATWIGYISGANSSEGNIYNCAFLRKNGIINGVGETDLSSISNTIEINDNLLNLINEENKFKEDKNNMNNGYPILIWQ